MSWRFNPAIVWANTTHKVGALNISADTTKQCRCTPSDAAISYNAAID
jgi:hypothetical protein